MSLAPSLKTWVVSIHATSQDYTPLGAGVLIDQRRVLTSAHVIQLSKRPRVDLWVAFPMCVTGFPDRRKVKSIRIAAHAVADVAILDLEMAAPGEVASAPLRQPPASSLVSRPWWAFGFPRSDPQGNEADGAIGASLGYGWLRLDSDSRYHVAPGFSGGGLWCPEYEAVVAIVGEANDRGDGRAIALDHVVKYLPQERIELLTRWTSATTGMTSTVDWDWNLSSDKEASRHWKPRARGVSVDSERGYRFRGRQAAMRKIVAWLDREIPDHRVLIVTGSPGVGKSAVLARIVTTADAQIRVSLPQESEIFASVGSVACAVHAKGKNALEVATEIARAVSAPLPDLVEDLPAMVAQSLSELGSSRRFNVIIDALDEAADPQQARQIVRSVVLPLAATCANIGGQVIVGCRRSDNDGDLLAAFGGGVEVIDLDSSEYFELDDLVEYAKATLQLRGAERPDSPYVSDVIATRVATRIGVLAEGNFLVGGLVARTHGLYDTTPVKPHNISFVPTVNSTLVTFVNHLGDVDGAPAREVLMALAYAEAPGFSSKLWQMSVEAIASTQVSERALETFARSSAANFIVESFEGRGEERTFRLFHKALGEALMAERSLKRRSVDDEMALTRIFLQYASDLGWDNVPPYLLRSLPIHASRCGEVDTLLQDPSFVIRADLRSLNLAATYARTGAGLDVSHILQLTPDAISATPALRHAMLSITEAFDGEGTLFREHSEKVAFRGLWSKARPRMEWTRLVGHRGSVTSVASVQIGHRSLIASGSTDGTVRIWDPMTASTERILDGHAEGVFDICTLNSGYQMHLASGGGGGTVNVWDPSTSRLIVRIEAGQKAIRSVEPVPRGESDLLATGGDDQIIRLWDPISGDLVHELVGHKFPVQHMTAFTVDERTFLASSDYRSELLIWKVDSGKVEHVVPALEDVSRSIRPGLCAFKVAGQTFLAQVCARHSIRIIDASTGRVIKTFDGDYLLGEFGPLCPIELGNRSLLALATGEFVQLWDPSSGQIERVVGTNIRSPRICLVMFEGLSLVATADGDSLVRLWDAESNTLDRPREDLRNWVNDLCVFNRPDGQMLVSASVNSKVQFWDGATGTLIGNLRVGTLFSAFPTSICIAKQSWNRDWYVVAGSSGGEIHVWDLSIDRESPIDVWRAHQRFGTGHIHVCTVRIGRRELIASYGPDEIVKIWKVHGRRRLVRSFSHLDSESEHPSFARPTPALTSLTHEGIQMLATAGMDHVIRVWDPRRGRLVKELEGHTGSVNALNRITRNNTTDLLVSASTDRTVRVWSVDDGAIHVLEGHHGPVRAACTITVGSELLIASAGNDQTVRLWGLDSGVERIRIPLHYDAVSLTEMHGSRLAVGTSFGFLIIGFAG